MASGTPPFQTDWVIGWLAQINGRREWPGRWQRAMIASWRRDWRSHVPGNGVGHGKNAAPVSASVAVIDRQKKLKALEDEADALDYELNALALANIEQPREKVERRKEIRRIVKDYEP
jgi:hypothetical protein